MKLFKALGVAFVLAISSQAANAATYDWDFSSPATSYFSTPSVNDTFNFILPYNPATVNAFTLSVFNQSDNLALTLFNGAGQQVDYSSNGYMSVAKGVLDTGSYATVTGSISGPSYMFSASVAPVPEPSTIALMLGGLGLVGFMVARREKLQP